MKHFKNILYIAGASPAGTAIERAVSLAENNQAELTVIDIVPVFPAGIDMHIDGSSPADIQSGVVNRRRLELESLVAPYRQRLNIQTDVLVGQMFPEAIHAVLRHKYDLLIKPVENPDFIERLFGSNDMHLLRKCPCPVWLTRPDEKSNYARILAAVDFTLHGPSSAQEQSLNNQILELASSLALSDFAELHLVHVWDAPGETIVRSWANNPNDAAKKYVESEYLRHAKAFRHFCDQLSDRIGKEACEHLAPQFHLERGAASIVIPALAKQLQAELVVMGTVARTGISGWFIGNTAESILEQLQCSVLAIKPSDFVSPVTLSD